MKLQKTIMLALAIILVSGAGAKTKAPKEKDMGAYLMVYHKDADHSLHMALSYDGYKWKALNGDRPIFAGDTIAEQKGIRDPHIFRAPNGRFYLAMTDLHLFAQHKGYRDTEWQRDGSKYGWGNNRALVMMESDNLIHWNRVDMRFDQLDPSLKEIGCVWAPEMSWDREKNKLMMLFTMRFGTEKEKQYFVYVNNDFNKIETLPQVLFAYPKMGIQAIDGDISYAGGMYHLMYVPHNGTPGIKQATSKSITGPWDYHDEWIDREPGACEAPNVYKLIGQNKWILMYDIYSIRPSNFGFMETTDFKTFNYLGHFNDADGKMKAEGFSQPKHGGVCWLTKAEAKMLENHYK